MTSHHDPGRYSRRRFIGLSLSAGLAAACRPADPPRVAPATSPFQTTLGPLQGEDLGIILPHEHVFVDLRTPDRPGYAQAEEQDVIALMAPELQRAKAAGIGLIVEATPIGVGRRADILKAVSAAAGYPLLVPTGVYREPWIPDWIRDAGEEQLRDWMLGELTGEIEDSGVQAGWIKLSAGDAGMTEIERKVLKAAAAAGAQTHAVIGSHTVRGQVVADQLAVIEQAGYTAARYIWIHAQVEPDFALHLEIARRGAWIEYDNIGAASDTLIIDRIKRVLDAGYGGQLLLSHDRGWYDPAQAKGGTPRPFTYLVESFLPRLREAGIDEDTVRRLTHDNPLRAFRRQE